MSSRTANLRFAGPLLLFLLAAMGSLTWVHYDNPRLLGSWHGFLHSAIATRFSVFSFPPENPFFAAEPLPYYWFYHFVGYWLSWFLRLDLLHTFHLLSWCSLIVLVVFSGWIGRSILQWNPAGLLIAYLAIAGLNPLGPAIAVSKHLVRGAPLLEEWSGPIETVFVSDALADRLMSQPLLGAMHVGADWRHGQNLPWFLDIGSRAPALALLMVLLFLLLRPGAGWRRHAVIVLVSSLLAAFNPLIGIAVAGAIAAASAAVFASDRKRLGLLGDATACLAGTILAAPTYYHLFIRVSGGAESSVEFPPGLLAFAVLGASFLILLPLALLGARHGKPQAGVRAIALSGLLLLAAALFVRLPEGNQHNFTNAAQCVLAVPAAAAVSTGRRKVVIALLLFVIFLPVTAGTLAAFAGRPPMPVAATGGTLARLPQSGELEEMYRWIRQHTSANSIFVTDPALPVKMSGNVSELPAFTSRTLFTDLPNYLTSPNRDAGYRRELASRATHAMALTASEQQYLRRLGRPVYIVASEDNVREVTSRMTALYGPPFFCREWVQVFRFDAKRGAQ
jgi:hypothetical protein